ncbi:glycosyltransferase, partial [Muribaculaceae bacterium Isolate-001 (NCI)]
MTQPKASQKITVVTVCYNAVKEIEKTIQSVISQTYDNVEYIIVDGGSTDGTLDIIRKYSSRITRWVSEPDKGIFDAMNKSAHMATGEYINFMNAGDLFFDEKVLSDIFAGRSYDED